MITLTAAQLIAGQPSRAGSAPFQGVNPRTRTRLDPVFVNATADEIDRAVIAAQAAYEQTRRFSAHRIADFLDRVADEIEALGDQLLEVADTETGLGIPRLTGERGRTTGQLRKFGALLREGSYVDAIIDPAQPDRKPLPRVDIRRMLFPIGPVAVFSASNFPFAFSVAGGDTASAFAAGCPVVVKAHPSHPATSELFAHAVNRAIEAADFPAGFFSLVQGDAIDVGQALVKQPGIMAVAFTGSLRGGRALFDSAAQRPVPIPVYAEMGSINPLVVLLDALAQRGDQIAQGLVNSVTLGAGQFCTNPGLVFLVDGLHTDDFVQTVTAKMAEAVPGVLLNANVERGLALVVDQTLAQPDVELLTGGGTVEGVPYCYTNTVMQTTSAAFRANPDLQHEHFGPVTLIVRCASEADLLTTLDVLQGNLTASLHATAGEIDAAAPLLDRLREKVGRVIWNDFPTGVEVGHAMQHGGPYPATTAPHTTSVGMTAIRRFLRPVAFQDVPDALLPDALKDANPLGIWRTVDDQLTRAPLG
ncbi:MAG: aldehyde dehydrogenase (NADP(+)) [Anaerolineae bacterium]|nr:aldehyde dehydrogenase (NADP(+)) [Anaerolineae bacterium]